MRKTIRVEEEILIKALVKCGYKQDPRRLGSFRKGRFHIIIYPKRGRADVHIHKNRRERIPHYLYPTRKTGEDLEGEIKKIMEELRGSVTTQKRGGFGKVEVLA